MRQLMNMTARACLAAGSRNHDKVMPVDVDYAISQEKFNFERFLLVEHYPILVAVCRDKNIDKDETGQWLLFRLTVLEYEGYGSEGQWNYINPVLKESEAFKQASKL